ncbi:serine/threonine-protein kinase [Streptomyces ureilyticus]|uniref:Protein kinase n=1 Tax=Streptomyces ureilyticus TaxID=1775131 RepID=A0ABX0DUT8_9ACTN|nr:serine/threonine-protein kinase [Streptomyces ureilyticus]NGO44435.1 protein kinase [Streptomyces ureilyticus]
MSDQRPQSPHSPATGNAALEQAGATPLQPSDPRQIGPYVPLGRLGSGGMGRVYLARQVDDGPGLAAVKVIRPEYAEDADFRRRFEREAAVHARVGPPHAPELLGTGFQDELLWMATRYLPGLSLSDAVKECGVLEPAGAWRLVAELGRALSALSAEGVVHRDLKPSNVILSEQGAHVIDFGISQAVDASAITGTGNRVGTPSFMSPEYLREGRCDTASDVFSLAGTLVYATTGHAPFGDGTGVDVLHRVAYEEPDAEVMRELEAMDASLADLLDTCLAKDPAGRPSPQELIEAAEAYGDSSSATPPWQAPLDSRLLERRQASEVLRHAAVQQTGHLRTPTQRVAAPAPGPGFGPATPQGAYGAGSQQTPPGAYGVGAQTPPYGSGSQTPPGPYGAPTPPGQFGPPSVGSPQPGSAPGHPPAGGRGNGGGRGRKKVYFAVVAGLAVCAVAVSAFLLTRPANEDTDASSTPTASETRTPDDKARAPLPSASDPSPSPSKEKEEKEEDGSGKESASPGGAGAAAGGDTGGGQGTTPTATPSATPSSGNGGGSGGSGGGTTPRPSPTKSTAEPAKPPWISQCTYYSGTQLTQLGDKNRRVTQVQCMLTKRGYGVGAAGVDGQFGQATLRAVKRFQGDKGLNVDGDVGPNTWAALRSRT